jgi:parvulin-like peptidyl-prolyl isomerase
MYRIILCLIIVFIACPGVAVAEDASAVFVKVNGAAITQKEVEVEAGRVVPRTLFHRNVSPEKMEVFMKEAAERLIDYELQFQEAKPLGLKADKKEIEAKIEEIKKKFQSNKEFKEALKKNNLTLKNLEGRIEKNIILEKVFKKEIEEKIKATDDEAMSHYESNLHRYKEMEQVKLRHIMIKFDKGLPAGQAGASDKGQEARSKEQEGKGKDAGAVSSDAEAGGKTEPEVTAKKTRTKEEARARAGEILAKLKDGGDFASIAYESSDDPYRVKGGDLGYVHRGRILPELEDAAFKTKVGEVMGPVETEAGFYIIKVEDYKQEKQLSFDEVKEKIKKELEKKRIEEKNKEWLSALRAKAKIEYAVGKEQGVGSKQ